MTLSQGALIESIFFLTSLSRALYNSVHVYFNKYQNDIRYIIKKKKKLESNITQQSSSQDD